MHPDDSLSERRVERVELIHADISREIIGGFYETYNELGFGFSEPIYVRALDMVLRERGLDVQREFPIIVYFRGTQIGFHRCDMLIERCVIVEAKATELLSPVAKSQLRNYLAATKLELGMLLHFGPRANYYRILGPRKPGSGKE
jgi:GxxExxY protein